MGHRVPEAGPEAAQQGPLPVTGRNHPGAPGWGREWAPGVWLGEGGTHSSTIFLYVEISLA